MSNVSASEIKERASEIMNSLMQAELEELCLRLNSEYEDYIYFM